MQTTKGRLSSSHTTKECEIVEGYIMKDHVHMLTSIPPKHSVSRVVGFLMRKDL